MLTPPAPGSSGILPTAPGRRPAPSGAASARGESTPPPPAESLRPAAGSRRRPTDFSSSYHPSSLLALLPQLPDLSGTLQNAPHKRANYDDIDSKKSPNEYVPRIPNQHIDRADRTAEFYHQGPQEQNLHPAFIFFL